MKVVIATRNPGKLQELRSLLSSELELLTLDDVGLDSPDETGSTFMDNARIKASHAIRSGHMAIADDSGLVVDALNGAPGVMSARYAGEGATDSDNNARLISELGKLDGQSRRARFASAVVTVSPSGAEISALGEVEGLIVDAPRGSNGFGYDPHFELADPDAGEFNGRTMAELTLEQKNQISHRARAYRALLMTISNSTGEVAELFAPLLPDESDGQSL